jgi:hypothetical protein
MIRYSLAFFVGHTVSDYWMPAFAGMTGGIQTDLYSAATLCAADTPRAFTTTLMASSTRSLA